MPPASRYSQTKSATGRLPFSLVESKATGLGLPARRGLSAHAIGHAFGSLHCCGSCVGCSGCQIMCPCIGGCSGNVTAFNATSVNAISNYANSGAGNCIGDIAPGPGKTSLAKGEIVESIFLPARAARSGDAYLRFIPRTEMDIAVVGVGVSLTLDASGTCTAARVSLGAVAATVLLVEEAAAALVGTPVDKAALERLAAACSAAAKPIDDKRGTIEFRTKVAGVLARRAATIALERAKG